MEAHEPKCAQQEAAELPLVSSIDASAGPADLSTILESLEPREGGKQTSGGGGDQPIYRMPAEWEPHSACLILFPHNPNTFRVDRASEEILALALAIATHGGEAVCLLCKDASHAEGVSDRLRGFLPKGSCAPIGVGVCPSDDTWARDTAPTFVFCRGRNDQRNRLIGMDWTFNAYGGPEEGAYWPCKRDQRIARAICSETTVAVDPALRGAHGGLGSGSLAGSLSISGSLSVPLVLEGGSFHTDGEGTLLTTAECLLNPNRNPHLSREDIEAVLKRALGVSVVLWLPYGLRNDHDTNGHVDNFCAFVRPGHVVLAWTDNEDEGGDEEDGDATNYERCRAAQKYLESHTDAMGRTIEITRLCLPDPPLAYTEEEAATIGQPSTGDSDAAALARLPNEPMAASYVNYYVANQAVLVPQFAAPGESTDHDRSLRETDQRALDTLRLLYPNRTVVGVPSREILLGGGNIHCQTQQVPAFVEQGGFR
ncbi:unnamed protein product [Pseudo-nitzschia multistriata]|uniref:Agmatine deiminase n=1 Tax=Pseudo-nitzschia multistriata TaxID=183589 RepID=A0A448ZLP2_9STRA|nr:unnamed protein product [Pseudo-nitzschia multistriata]